jgi:DNA processing protein
VTEHRLQLAALVAVLSQRRLTVVERRELRATNDALGLLEARHGLLASSELERASQLLDDWDERGIAVVSERDPVYPANLRAVADRPPALFVLGRLLPEDGRCVAVVGTRRPTAQGRTTARRVAAALVAADYTVASGLAAGIDTAAHTHSLAVGGRTVAVVGTGVDRCYPPENSGLQRRIASSCAVVSCFPPGAPPTRRSFPIRNSVMSGLARATVIVQASATSGTRIQARTSLAQGRPVVLLKEVLEQDWAAELSARDGVIVAEDAGEVPDLVSSLDVANWEPAEAACGTRQLEPQKG